MSTTQEPQKLGRPPKPDEERKSYMLRIRMTEEQREVLQEASGGNLSDWARDVLLRAAKRRQKA